MTLAELFYGRKHPDNRRRLYNAWKGRRGVSALRQRVLHILCVDEDGNATDVPAEVVSPGVFVSLCLMNITCYNAEDTEVQRT